MWKQFLCSLASVHRVWLQVVCDLWQEKIWWLVKYISVCHWHKSKKESLLSAVPLLGLSPKDRYCYTYMPSGLKPDEIGFCRIRRLVGSCRDEPGRFREPDWNAASKQETQSHRVTHQLEYLAIWTIRTFSAPRNQRIHRGNYNTLWVLVMRLTLLVPLSWYTKCQWFEPLLIF